MGRRKGFRIDRWTEEEMNVLRNELALNAGGPVPFETVKDYFPNRSAGAIGMKVCDLRKEMGYPKVYNGSGTHVHKPNGNGTFIAALSEFMESWVKKQMNGNVEAAVAKAVKDKDEEIESLKTLLRDLKAVREAVEKLQAR